MLTKTKSLSYYDYVQGVQNLKPEELVSLLEVISVTLKNMMKLDQAKHSIMELEGLGAEIRNSNAGIAVKNRKKFWRAIVKLLKNKKLREKYSKNALKYVKKVNGWHIISRKTFQIYEKFW